LEQPRRQLLVGGPTKAKAQELLQKNKDISFGGGTPMLLLMKAPSELLQVAQELLGGAPREFRKVKNPNS